MKTLITIALLVTMAGGCMAAPSGLNLIPTADVYDKGAVAIEFGSQTSENRVFKDSNDGYWTEFGLGYGVEAGYDIYRDAGTLRVWNVKGARPVGKVSALALGIQNIGDHSAAQFYAVGYTKIDIGRVHAGVVALGNRTCGMFGYDVAVTPRVTLQADYTTGADNAASAGVGYSVTEHTAITAALVRENSSTDRWGYLLILGWYPKL